jgi:hypothetical protein
VTGPADVPEDVLAGLRAICTRLPEVHEQPAWVGVRWRVRAHTFAHVLVTAGGRPAAHVRASGVDGGCLLVFRAEGVELDVLRRTGPPFFRAPWGEDVVGMVLGADVDWAEVGELLTDSYCVRAPRRLAALVDRPPG